jgi:SAM-dependent methyltransferase
MEPSAAIQSDLRFLLPVRSDENVILFDPDDELIGAIRSENARLTVVRSTDIAGSKLPFQSASLDHIFVPVLTKNLYAFFPMEFSRILRPGGWLFVGVGNMSGLKRLLFWKDKKKVRPVCFTLNGCRMALQQANFRVINSFGILRDLNSPQYVIGLERPDLSKFFFHQVFYPATATAAIGQRAAGFFATLGLHRCLYRDFGIVARRSVNP